MKEFDAALLSLQRRWGVAVFLYALGLAGLGVFLRLYLSLTQALLWLGMSALVGFYILSYLYTRLPENRRPEELHLLPSFGPGTMLTLIGGWLLAALGGFILIARPEGPIAWLPALLFLASLLADLFDGYLARRFHHVTLLGKELDMTLDGMGVLLATVLVVRWGQWPFWFVIVGLARYLFIWGLQWRERKNLPIQELKDSEIRRLLAGMQRGFLFVAMWPMVPAWLATATGLAFVLPFLVNFTYDWLVASTVIDDNDPEFRKALHALQSWMYGPVSLGLRVVASLLVALLLWRAWAHLDAFSLALQGMWGAPPWVASLAVGMGLVLAACLLLGIVPRLAAVLLYAPVSLILAADMSFWLGLAAFYGLTAVILLGPGPWTLWQPEARVFTRRLGS